MGLKDKVKAEILAGRGISPSVIADRLGRQITEVRQAIAELQVEYQVENFGDWNMLCNTITGGSFSKPAVAQLIKEHGKDGVS